MPEFKTGDHVVLRNSQDVRKSWVAHGNPWAKLWSEFVVIKVTTYRGHTEQGVREKSLLTITEPEKVGEKYAEIFGHCVPEEWLRPAKANEVVLEADHV